MVFGFNIETLAHHGIGIIGIVAALWIGQMVGVINQAFLVTEISTIFLDIMFILKILKLEDDQQKLKKINALLLMASFVISRIFYLGYFIVFYVTPAMWNYPLELNIETLGWAKIIVSVILCILLVVLMLINVFWAKKLWRGYKKSQRDQNVIAGDYINTV